MFRARSTPGVAYHGRAMPVLRSAPRDRRKATARDLVARFDLEAVERWAAAEPQATRVLQQLLFDADELVAWRAVEAMGRAAAVLARDGPERVRELVRRAFWLMNDESGGVLWLGPQVAGAVLAGVPALCGELGSVLAAFLEDDPFRAGTRWGLWRMSGTAPEVVRDAAPRLRASLGDPDPGVRGHAALALHGAGVPVPELASDHAPFVAFDFRTGELRETTVAAASAGWIDPAPAPGARSRRP